MTKPVRAALYARVSTTGHGQDMWEGVVPKSSTVNMSRYLSWLVARE